MDTINDKGYYVGSEVQWGTEDVEAIAVNNFGLHLSNTDLRRVLTASLQDNEWLMERFRDAISDTILHMIEHGELRTCLQWSKVDIITQGKHQGLDIDDKQASELLNGFFKDNNEHIIEVINTAMAEYVRAKHNKQ